MIHAGTQKKTGALGARSVFDASDYFLMTAAIASAT